MSRRLGLLLVAVALALLPSAAMADDGLLARSPGVREELRRPPSTVTLAFGHELDSSVVRIYVLDDDGDNVTAGPPQIDATNATVDLADGMKQGTYSVYYRVNGPDGGVAGGAYQFAIGQGRWSDLDTPAEWTGGDDEPEIFSGSNPNRPGPDDPEDTLEPGLEVITEDGETLRPDVAEEPQGEVVTPDEEQSGRSPWWWIGGGVLVAAAAGAVIAWRRGSGSGTRRAD